METSTKVNKIYLDAIREANEALDEAYQNRDEAREAYIEAVEASNTRKVYFKVYVEANKL